LVGFDHSRQGGCRRAEPVPDPAESRGRHRAV